ncbi:molybdenum cofactor guanylyltransferase [Corallococcus macrosporus]|uniref:Probable molybdenum cofactor guanylyltransferase n=1 Tax=Corallococcus macrosporus DSM 14697 TaxID=1189310 RepID=A0A286NWC8_9BACT|nr:molybdenum cofactor guanylyltransferase [Corallococcus macrosporus]ATB51473.1 molybdenum cofactor guanylyltransferase [Corallococcus macrosporus DSM 14697]
MERSHTVFPEVTLAILAGGQGRRLSGVPKGLLEVEGRAVLERLLTLAPRFEDVLLVANVPGPYARFGLRTVADVVPGKGAPGGVHAALVAARTPWVVAVACDMPFITMAALRVLLDAREDSMDAVCFEVAGRLEPLLAAYRPALAPAWGDALATNPSMRELLSNVRTRLLPEETLRAVDPSLRSLANVNTPEDLARYGVALPSWRG